MGNFGQVGVGHQSYLVIYGGVWQYISVYVWMYSSEILKICVC